MKNCKNCYYQEINFLGRICKHKRNMEGTEAEAGFDFCADINLCDYYVPYEKMADTYIITKITDLSGIDRIDGRYPLRIERICKKPKVINNRLFLYYLKNADGSDYSGKVYMTSKINTYQKTKDKIVVVTENSIYYFDKINKNHK